LIAKILKYLLTSINFLGIVMLRFSKILLRKRKNIEVVYLNYSDRHLFESSFIILNYSFKNALWYRFGKHRTIDEDIKIFNLKNFEKEFDLVVYGFFRKKVFRLKFEPTNILKTDKFKTQFNHLTSDLEIKTSPNFYRLPLLLKLYELKTNNVAIVLQHQKIELKTNKYNQTDFI